MKFLFSLLLMTNCSYQLYWSISKSCWSLRKTLHNQRLVADFHRSQSYFLWSLKLILWSVTQAFFDSRSWRSYVFTAIGVFAGDYPASPPSPRWVLPSWAFAACTAAAAAFSVLGLASCLLLRTSCRGRQDAAALPTIPAVSVAATSPVTSVSCSLVRVHFVCFLFNLQSLDLNPSSPTFPWLSNNMCFLNDFRFAILNNK